MVDDWLLNTIGRTDLCACARVCRPTRAARTTKWQTLSFLARGLESIFFVGTRTPLTVASRSSSLGMYY